MLAKNRRLRKEWRSASYPSPSQNTERVSLLEQNIPYAATRQHPIRTSGRPASTGEFLASQPRPSGTQRSRSTSSTPERMLAGNASETQFNELRRVWRRRSTNVSPLVHGAEMRVAETRAVSRREPCTRPTASESARWRRSVHWMNRFPLLARQRKSRPYPPTACPRDLFADAVLNTGFGSRLPGSWS